MSYYDNLGVGREAGPDEIRESYRILARLLHPDQQMDASLKAAAELQMRRINLSHAVLSDPEKRRRYDAELDAHALPIIIQAPMPHAKTRLPSGTLAWAAAAIASAGLIYWLSSQGLPTQPRQDLISYPQTAVNALRRTAIPAVEKAPDRNAEALVETLRDQLRLAIAERDAALQQLSRAHMPRPSEPYVAPARVEATTRVPITTPAPIETALPPPIATAEPEAPHNAFAGMWFYTKSKNPNKDKQLYPPEFIEAMIVETEGGIHGKYRARYNIADRAISPDVNFEFDGHASAPAARLPWRGLGGSKGEVQLKLVSENSIEIVWSASELGGSLGLLSGTAILLRRPN